MASLFINQTGGLQGISSVTNAYNNSVSNPITSNYAPAFNVTGGSPVYGGSNTGGSGSLGGNSSPTSLYYGGSTPSPTFLGIDLNTWLTIIGLALSVYFYYRGR